MIKFLTIMDIGQVYNFIVNIFDKIIDILFNKMIIKIGNMNASIGNIYITVVLISFLLKIILTARARGISTTIEKRSKNDR